ncbi:hypothetical protein DPMN_161012 [Dreissena polymorpha]|uniref:Secreted protein n=1 Tax=Dreissena polymorpha TaxID=45954 RepID=A0A9D4ELW0_DREPO|nr:hypothetical protein DPMN_161012 [Dreissena polymorpha]
MWIVLTILGTRAVVCEHALTSQYSCVSRQSLVERSDRPGYTDSRLRARTYQFIQLCLTDVPGGLV